MDSVNPDPNNIPDEELGLQNYQDDLDTSSSIHDPVTDDNTDDPTKELGVDPKEFKQELDKYAFDDGTKGVEDDRREDMEDLDQDDGDDTKY